MQRELNQDAVDRQEIKWKRKESGRQGRDVLQPPEQAQAQRKDSLVRKPKVCARVQELSSARRDEKYQGDRRNEKKFGAKKGKKKRPKQSIVKLRGKTGTTGPHTNPSRPPTQRKCQRLPTCTGRARGIISRGVAEWMIPMIIISETGFFSFQGSRPWLPDSLTCIMLSGGPAVLCNISNLSQWKYDERWTESFLAHI